MNIQRQNRLTEHAQKRKRQRGITDLQIRILEVFADDHYQKGGSFMSYISEKQIIQLRNALDRLKGVALIKGDQDSVVTVMHSTRKISKTQYSA